MIEARISDGSEEEERKEGQGLFTDGERARATRNGAAVGNPQR
jgi:hypothetical protein